MYTRFALWVNIEPNFGNKLLVTLENPKHGKEDIAMGFLARWNLFFFLYFKKLCFCCLLHLCTSIVRLSTFRPNMWIPIIYFILFLGKEGYVSQKKQILLQ